MPTLATPAIALLVLVPGLGLAAIATFLSDAPAEWGVAAMTAWSAVAAALLAGASLGAGAGPLAWIPPAAGVAALLLGGPSGLALAALALVVAALPAPLPAPRWLPLALAAAAAVAAARRLL
jgi:hypothetical protein